MLAKRLFLLICFFWVALCLAQKSETHKLLEQATEMVSYNPQESKKIAEYTLKLSDNPKQIAVAHNINATAFYVMGLYDEALNHVFASKNLLQNDKNSSLNQKNIALTTLLFNRLKLKNYQANYLNKNLEENKFYRTDQLLSKAYNFKSKGKEDSVNYCLQEVKTLLNFENPGYFEVIYYHFLGDLFFEKKEFIQALDFYQKSEFLAHKINNPFLEKETQIRLASSYLILDSIYPYRQSSERIKQLMIETSEIENKASNQAYTLIVNSLDRDLIQKEKRYQSILLISGIFAIMVIGLKILLSIRNRNKVKTLSQMLSYLQNLEEKMQKQITPSAESEPLKKEVNLKTGNLLKESEDQILLGLTKFENSTKFTQNDMSLGKLAVLLNTNTKYLSEAINRHKGKNFNAYVNELRINYIIEKLKSDPSYLNYKVSYLAEECGFSSHSSFATVFKSIVGVSPSVFIDFLNDENLKKKEVS